MPIDMLLDAPYSFRPVPGVRRAAECLGDPSECATDAISCAGDPFGCTYSWRAPFTIALEQAFRRLSDGNAVPLEGGITLITDCKGICELVQAPAFAIGHTIFTTQPGLQSDTIRHEKEHVRQYEIMGDTFWGPWLASGGASVIGCFAVKAFGGDYGDCLHDTNILEILAR